MRLSLAACTALLLSACASVRGVQSRAALTPRVDYHQHLVSPAFAPIVKLPPRNGRALLAELDSAGIEKAVVLSVGYSFAVPLRTEEMATIADNVTRFAR